MGPLRLVVQSLVVAVEITRGILCQSVETFRASVVRGVGLWGSRP